MMVIAPNGQRLGQIPQDVQSVSSIRAFLSGSPIVMHSDPVLLTGHNLAQR